MRKLYGEVVYDAEERLASSMALLEQKALFRVQERLGAAMQHPSLREALVRMERARSEVLPLRQALQAERRPERSPMSYKALLRAFEEAR